MATVVQVVFTAHEPDSAGRLWVTAQISDGAPVTIGYTRHVGDAVAVHGSAEGWPRVAVCAGPAAALAALISTWGQELASCTDLGEMMEL